MPLNLTKKPQRIGTDWLVGLDVSARGGQHIKAILSDHALLTCRDCYGFGHSKTKCPTAKKLDAVKVHGKSLLSSVVSRYRTD